MIVPCPWGDGDHEVVELLAGWRSERTNGRLARLLEEKAVVVESADGDAGELAREPLEERRAYAERLRELAVLVEEGVQP